MRQLVAGEQARFDQLLDDAAPEPGTDDELRAAVAALAAARRAGA